MNKFLLIFLSAVLFSIISCSGSSGGGSNDSNTPASVSPYDGQSYFFSGTKTGTTDKVVIYMKLSGNKALGATLIINTSTNKVQYRKSTGTFTFSGDKYVVNWSYETCNPVHNENVILRSSDPTDYVMMSEEGSPTTIKLFNSNKYYITGVDLNQLSIYTEDVACSMLAKIQNTNQRLPASFKNKFSDLSPLDPEKKK